MDLAVSTINKKKYLDKRYKLFDFRLLSAFFKIILS